ncbi:hypothetical protein [Acetobacterium sp. UBA5834]|uniref:hypothetical protein n=1 Tax=Acetobacterium sp. UBA5834 TaxID=1945907 RepID=UPI00257CD585|nr:hypothetical protein [Acetobacterium sp. UBA5834]
MTAASNPSVSYRTHVQNEGWQGWEKDGTMSGTSAKGLRLEGIEVKLDTQGYDLGINYQTHIQNIGWEADTERGWKSNGTMSGTEGLSYRLEAIQIKLTGSDASKFDVYYQVHAQNMGWLGWAKNGESAGTAGYGYRLEAINIVVVPAGTGAPSGVVDKAEPFYENPLSLYPSIASDIEELNWKNQYIGQLYYYYEDLSNDGIPELIIGRPVKPQTFTKFPYSGELDQQVSLIYQITNGTPTIVLGRDAQIRGRYYLDANNYIIDFGSGGAAYHGWSYYKINGYDLNFIEAVHLDTSNGEVYSLREKNEKLIKYLTKSEAYGIFNKYSIKSNIDWSPLVF